MKIVFAIGALAATIAAAAADAPFWTAICRDDRDANYTQTVGGTGVFNTANDDGTYVTLPMRQIYYKPNAILCGAATAAGSEQIGQVCADNLRQVIVLKLRDPHHPKGPLKPMDYCRALVKVH